MKKINGNIAALQAEVDGLQMKAGTAASEAQAGIKGAEARAAEAESRAQVEAARTEAESSKQKTILIASVAGVAGMVLIAIVTQRSRSIRERETITYRGTARGAA